MRVDQWFAIREPQASDYHAVKLSTSVII